MSEPMTNRDVENAAVAFVIEYEVSQGRKAVDTRGKLAPADVESDDRVIEVKATGVSARGQDLWLEKRQVDEAAKNPDFWVYLVDNVRQGDPAQFGLRLLGGSLLSRLLVNKRMQTTYTVPFPVAEYDAAPAGQIG